MKLKELAFEETEASNTIGGAGQGHVQVRGKWRGCKCYYSAVRYTLFNRSRRLGIRHQDEGSGCQKNSRTCVDGCLSEERGHGVGVVCR